MKRIYKLLVLAGFSAGACVAAEPVPGCVASRIVPFDTFMQGQLKSVPLSVPVPKNYVAVTAEEMTRLTYSYWMPKKEIKKALASHKLPANTGYMYGKLSLNAGYLPETDHFTVLDDDAAAAGMTILSQEQFSVGGHSVLLMEVKIDKLERKVWSLWIAMNVDTNAAYFTFVPPNNDTALGDCYWQYLKQVLRSAPPGGAAS